MSYLTGLATNKMESLFKENLPDSLYMSHYELSENLGSTPTAWSEYLKEQDTKRFIEREIATIAESAARKALNTLGTTDSISSQQVSALKEILNKSQLIQQKSNSKNTIIITYLPKKEKNNA